MTVDHSKNNQFQSSDNKTAADLIEQLEKFDGSPGQFLTNLLAVHCFIAQANGGAILHINQKRGVDDDYIQPGNLYRLMPPEEQKRLIENIVGTLKKVSKDIQEKMVAHFRKADQSYGDGVANGLGLS